MFKGIFPKILNLSIRVHKSYAHQKISCNFFFNKMIFHNFYNYFKLSTSVNLYVSISFKHCFWTINCIMSHIMCIICSICYKYIKHHTLTIQNKNIKNLIQSFFCYLLYVCTMIDMIDVTLFREKDIDSWYCENRDK